MIIEIDSDRLGELAKLNDQSSELEKRIFSLISPRIKYIDLTSKKIKKAVAVDSSSVTIRLRGGHKILVVTAVAQGYNGKRNTVTKIYYVYPDNIEVGGGVYEFSELRSLLMKYTELLAIKPFFDDGKLFIIDGSIKSDAILLNFIDLDNWDIIDRSIAPILRIYIQLLEHLISSEEVLYASKTIMPSTLAEILEIPLELSIKDGRAILDYLSRYRLKKGKPFMIVRENVSPVENVISDKRNLYKNLPLLEELRVDEILGYFGINPLVIIPFNIDDGSLYEYLTSLDYSPHGMINLINLVDTLAKSEAKLLASKVESQIDQITTEREYIGQREE